MDAVVKHLANVAAAAEKQEEKKHKNIVLLSDGTGNSAGKLLKTNVWRVYESLQLRDPSLQVACYDDGVGTSSFKPLAVLGGAIGIGLRGNVLRLYRFLCEYHDPGDRIFLFGFSRGAFTVRVPHEQPGTKGSLKVKIGRPKIHESVFTRMSAAPEAYAPIVFPKEYAVVMEDGRILDGDENPFEPSAAAVKRFASQEKVWDLVWRRRVLYFATVAVTLVVLVLPVVDRGAAASSTRDAGIVGGIVATLGEWLPSFASWWVEYYTAKPWELILSLAILFVIWRVGKRLQSSIRDEMRGIWQKVIPPTVGHYTELDDHDSWLKSLRLSNRYQGFSAWWRHKVLPAFFGFTVLSCFIVALVYLAALASRVPFEVASAMGGACPEGAAERLRVGQSTGPLILESRDFCSRTGVLLEENRHYEFRFTITSVANEPWQDGDVQVKYSAEGFTRRTPGLTFLQQILFTVAIPVRRVLSADWFVPLARVGDRGGHSVSARCVDEEYHA